MTEPKLVLVKFRDHTGDDDSNATSSIAEIKRIPVPIAIISRAGWLVKEDDNGIVLFSMLTEYPDLQHIPRSEGYSLSFAVVKSTIIEMKELRPK